MSDDRYNQIRDALDGAENAPPIDALRHLRSVLDIASAMLDEQMARAVVESDVSIRSAASAAGLSENAVGPRLARTSMLADYARPNGRVTAADVRRAQYDREAGAAVDPADKPTPLRFKPRRST
ncbi:UNVERIFIED_CONTAM: hypothetical protein DES50_111143 [Williamsia faeni]